MNAQRVYSSKKSMKSAVAVHGRVGWSADSTDPEALRHEVICFCDEDGAGAWMLADDYRELRKQQKKANVEYYRRHPEELALKKQRRNHVRWPRLMRLESQIYVAEGRVVEVGDPA